MPGRRQDVPRNGRGLPRRRWPVAVTCVSSLVLAGTLATGPVADELGIDLPWRDSQCTPVHVEIVTSNDVRPVVSQILQDQQDSPLPGNRCLRTYVRGQAPADTVASVDQLPDDRIPHLWIPDSSLWINRVPRWRPHQIGTFATSPLVVASSKAAITDLGWSGTPPTWGKALTGGRTVVLPDLTNDTSGVLALLAMWQSLNRTERADHAVAAAVLAATRQGAPQENTVMDAARDDRKDSPLLPTSELRVRTRNAAVPGLVAAYPRDGSPWLDYPLVRLSAQIRDEHRTAAVAAVVDALTSPRARTVLYDAGLRDSDRRSVPPTRDSGPRHDTVDALGMPDATQTQEFLDHLSTLSMPSRLLVAVDVSESMRSPTPHGISRAELAGRAARQTGTLLSDRSSAGLWVFSHNATGNRNTTELAPVRPLSTAEQGHTHRDTLDQQLLSLRFHIAGDGTALNETAVRAVRTMRNSYSPRAANAVVIFTGGTNEDEEQSLSLKRTIAELKALSDPRRPVRLVVIGIGSTVDMTHLQALSGATGARAYRVHDPEQVDQVLFDVISRRDET